MSSARIAIVGGGIGGLAAAAFLHKAGLPCVLYEQASRLREVGAGLIVAPNAARLLRRLDVLDALRKSAVRLETGWEFRRWADGTILSAEDLSIRCERLYGEHTYTAHRADLLGAAQAIEDAAALARRLAGDRTDPVAALRRYEADRIPRTSRLQEASHHRAHINHLPDGPAQRARDEGFATTDPLEANAWIYAHDPAG